MHAEDRAGPGPARHHGAGDRVGRPMTCLSRSPESAVLRRGRRPCCFAVRVRRGRQRRCPPAL